ncbi:MAG: histidinol dehydrogenase, partial [Pseudomonadota bacterium]
MTALLRHDAPDFDTRFRALTLAKRDSDAGVDGVVAELLADVRARGIEAVLELTRRFDRWEATEATLAFTEAEIDAAVARVPPAEREALELAADRIRAYHTRQLPEDAEWEDEAGIRLGWRWSAVGAAGLYVPGGTAAYPSSV